MNKKEFVVEYYNKTINDYGMMLTETPIYDREVALDLGQRSIKAMLERYGYEVYFRVMEKVSTNSVDDEDEDEIENEDIDDSYDEEAAEFIDNCIFYYDHIMNELENTCEDVEDRYNFSESDGKSECSYYLQYRLPVSHNLIVRRITMPCDTELDDGGDVDVARALCRALNGASLTLKNCDEIINEYVKSHMEE